MTHPIDTTKLGEISPELAELMQDIATCHTADLLAYALDKRNHTRRFKALAIRLDTIAQTLLDQQAKIEGLEEALKQIQDYCDLGLVLFLKSNRFEHLVKLVDDVLGGDTAKDRYGGNEAARQGERE